MLIEDDVAICDNAEIHFVYILSKVGRTMGGDDGWSAIRVGQGLIGIILQCRDVPAYIDYLETHILDGPVDYVLADYWTKHTRQGKEYFGSREFVTYRYNLFRHLGRVSSFTNHNEEAYGRVYHRCYDTLSTLLHPREMFHPWCLHDDISPCGPPRHLDSADFFSETDAVFKQREEAGNIHPFLVSPYSPLTNSPLFVEDFTGVEYAAATYESCDEACLRFNLICDEYVLLHLNNCGAAQKYLGCKSCAIATGQDFWYPGVVMPPPPGAVDNGAYPGMTGICMVSPILALLRCDGKSVRGTFFRRLCPCRAPQKK